MASENYSKLPHGVRDVIFSDEYGEQGIALHEKHGLTAEQLKFVRKLQRDLVFKRKKMSELLTTLALLPEKEKVDLHMLALDIALERMWPISFYIEDVDVIIRRLGGVVPKNKPAPPRRRTAIGEEGWTFASIKDALASDKSLEEMYITQKPIKNIDNRLRAPSVKNWLEDYLHTMGAEGGDSMKRSKYLAQSRNVAKLNESEKENLLNFLISYEDGIPMQFQIAEEQYLLIRPDLPEENQQAQKKEQSAQKMEDLVQLYKTVQQNYDSSFQNLNKGLEIEVGENTKKLADVIWDALGMLEVDRCLAAINMLIERHGFIDMLKTDRRFQGIVARFVTARFGPEARNYWKNENVATTLGLTLFWELIMVEKLGLEENKAAIITDLFRKKLGQTTSPVYLDLKAGGFHYRGVAYMNRSFKLV